MYHARTVSNNAIHNTQYIPKLEMKQRVALEIKHNNNLAQYFCL